MSPALREADLRRSCSTCSATLGWTVRYGPEIAPGELAAERGDYREVVLIERLRDAVAGLNPELPLDAVEDAVKTALRPESQVAESENWRAYRLLVEGVPVDFRGSDGTIRSARARLVDFDDPGNNDFLAVNQFTVLGTRERRPDVVLFVNGLPLVLMELKRPGDENATLRGAFNQIQTYRAQIPDIFTWNQVTVISDGTQARAGSFTAGWEHFAPWKTIDGQDLAPSGLPQYEVLVQGMFQPAVLLDLVRNFVAMYGEGRRMAKLVAKYHQYWAVRKAVDCTVEAVEGDGRAGVVWHTQGSGKSLEMLFYTGKVIRHPAMENPTVVVLTDRNDLDDQLFDEVFAGAKVGAPLPEAPVQAESREHLKQLLLAREGGGIVFSTIQKFGLSQADKDAGRAFPLLSDRVNIVVMVDEAHRSNYDFVDGFARHLRDGAAQRDLHRVHRHADRERGPFDPPGVRRLHRHLRPHPGGHRRRDRQGVLRAAAGKGGAARRSAPGPGRRVRRRHLGHRGRGAGAAEDPVGAGRGDRRVGQADRRAGRGHRRALGAAPRGARRQGHDRRDVAADRRGAVQRDRPAAPGLAFR